MREKNFIMKFFAIGNGEQLVDVLFKEAKKISMVLIPIGAPTQRAVVSNLLFS